MRLECYPVEVARTFKSTNQFSALFIVGHNWLSQPCSQVDDKWFYPSHEQLVHTMTTASPVKSRYESFKMTTFCLWVVYNFQYQLTLSQKLGNSSHVLIWSGWILGKSSQEQKHSVIRKASHRIEREDLVKVRKDAESKIKKL